MATMKAVVIYEAGGPEVLKVEERPVPTAQPGWVLIKVKAFGLNRSEMFTRQGHSPVKFPRILGIEATGVVEEAFGGDFQKGDVVLTAMGGMGRNFDGGYAQFTSVPAGQIQKVQTTLGWDILGACGEMLQTAYGSLFKSLRLQEGETLLIRGGSSSVGLAAAALAKNHGAKVISTSRRAEREGLLKQYGAAEVVVDDGNIAEEVKKMTNGGADKVLEMIGTTTLLDSLQCARQHGVVCMTGIVGDSWTCQDFAPMTAIPKTVCLTTYAGMVPEFMETPLQELVQQVEAGTLPIPVGKTFKLEEIVEAHWIMDNNTADGKIVILTE